ncbi:MAG: STAS-like domain-containing protein [Bacteroidales bacterium]
MKTEKIVIKEITSGTLSNIDGLNLKIAIDSSLASADTVLLSFEGITTISSSFLNSSIGEIMDQYGFDILKDRIKITHYTSNLATIIKKYIDDLRYTECH